MWKKQVLLVCVYGSSRFQGILWWFYFGMHPKDNIAIENPKAVLQILHPGTAQGIAGQGCMPWPAWLSCWELPQFTHMQTLG